MSIEKGWFNIKRLQRFVKNAVLLGLAIILMRTVSVVFNAYASNKIGAEGMGLFSLIMSVYMFAVTLATSGASLAVTRLVSEEIGLGNHKNAIAALRKCVVYSLIFGIGSGVILFCGAGFIADKILTEPRTEMSLRALSVSLPFIALSNVFSGYFYAVRRIVKSASASIIEQFIKISLVVNLFIIMVPKGIEYACLALVIGTSVAEGLSFIYLYIFYVFDKKKHLKNTDSPKVDSKSLRRRMLSISLPIAFSAYLRSGLVTIEHILIPIGLRKSGADTQTALASYGTIHGMVFPLILFPSAVCSAFASLIVPEMSELNAIYGSPYNNKHICYIARRAIQWALIFGIGVAGIFICYAKPLGMLVYKSEDAGKYIGILASLIPIMYLDITVDGMLKGLNQQISSMRYNIIDAATSVVLVYTLLPKIGITGYVISAFVTEMLNLGLSLNRLLLVTNAKIPILPWVFAPAACIIGATSISLLTLRAVSGLFKYAVTGTVFGIVSTIIFYSALLVMIGSVSRENLSWINKILKSGKLNKEENIDNA